MRFLNHVSFFFLRWLELKVSTLKNLTWGEYQKRQTDTHTELPIDRTTNHKYPLVIYQISCFLFFPLFFPSKPKEIGPTSWLPKAATKPVPSKNRGKNWVFKLGDQGLGYYEAVALENDLMNGINGQCLFSWIYEMIGCWTRFVLEYLEHIGVQGNLDLLESVWSKGGCSMS